MNIPLVDLKAQYRLIRDEINAAIQEVIDECAFTGGAFVSRFEQQFAAFCNRRHAIGVGSGTAALELILRALGIGPGDEVITAPNSFIATAEAISLCGATPVFADVDPVTHNLDPSLAAGAITERTRAIIPVHLFGQMADMDPLSELSARHGIPVIEDACQAHGAEYKNRPAGSIGLAAAFSFYPGKNMGAYGDAGAVVTGSDELGERIRLLRDHGQNKKYSHRVIGTNHRMDGIQAAVLSVKMKYISDWNSARRRHAALYNKLLARTGQVTVPHEAPYARHVYHIYAIRTDRRQDCLKWLDENGIQAGIHYPVPIHLQPAYGFLQLKKGSFPAAEQCAEELISLPIYPEISPSQIECVAAVLNDFFSTGIEKKVSAEGA